MKNYRIGGNRPDSLTFCDEAMPRLQRGELLLKVHAVSLNYRDLVLMEGDLLRADYANPVPVSDGAAEVVEVGEGVDDFRPGDRVLGTFHPRWFGGPKRRERFSGAYGRQCDGWLTEYKVVSRESVVPLPDALSYEQGATLPCAAVTAWNALMGPVPVKAGDCVLTLGSGGVSVFASQYAKALGARVIATTSSAAKAERLRALGADATIDYRALPEWGDEVKRLTGGEGAHRVIEVGGPGTIAQSLKAVAYDGEVVLVGFLDQNAASLSYFDIMGSGASLRSTNVGDRTSLEQCLRATAVTGIEPVIDRVFPFTEAREAFLHLKRGGHFGKVVIRVSEP